MIPRLSKIKVQFRVGTYTNCFSITPALRVTYSAYKREAGFAIELAWGKWGIGWRFYPKTF